MGLEYSLPLLLIPFVLMVVYRKPILDALLKVRIPRFLLALLLTIPLIVYEEHINCGAYGCTSALIPPTLPYVFALIALMLFVTRVLPFKDVVLQTVFWSVLGVVFELTLGVANAELMQFSIAHPFWFIVVLVWTGFSYAFVLYLPLLLLKNSGQIGAR